MRKMKNQIRRRILILSILLLFIIIAVTSLLPRYCTICDYSSIYEITNMYPHSINAFTEGLYFSSGFLYESVGNYGSSRLLQYTDTENGTYVELFQPDESIFLEGAAELNGKIYLLTWHNNEIIIINSETHELIESVNYNREGWGLTTDGEHLIASDGSSNIYFMDESLHTIKTLTVTQYLRKIDGINELEYINGFIWANIWGANQIVKIDPNTGYIKTVVDFTELVPEDCYGESVLNGIAYYNNMLYITGKNWPYIYELIPVAAT